MTQTDDQADRTGELASLFLKLDGKGRENALQFLRDLSGAGAIPAGGESGLSAAAQQSMPSLELSGMRTSENRFQN